MSQGCGLSAAEDVTGADKSASDASCVSTKRGRRRRRDRKPSREDTLLEKTLVDEKHALEPLTRRETQILRLIVMGKSNREIAEILNRTERTVEYHRNRVMGKLDAHNLVELIKRALEMGIA